VVASLRYLEAVVVAVPAEWSVFWPPESAKKPCQSSILPSETAIISYEFGASSATRFEPVQSLPDLRFREGMNNCGA
jgi:hypothetical protein